VVSGSGAPYLRDLVIFATNKNTNSVYKASIPHFVECERTDMVL
jgi:membrane-bound inhibitor of C-type lysozyme